MTILFLPFVAFLRVQICFSSQSPSQRLEFASDNKNGSLRLQVALFSMFAVDCQERKTILRMISSHFFLSRAAIF